MKNKLLALLLSVGIALVLWLYVVTVVSPNSDNHYYNIPVNLQGEAVLQDRGLMITSGELPTVSLHLEGNRSDLNQINSSNIAIGVDVSGIGEPGTYNLSLTAPNFLTDVPNNAITVLSKDPSTVTVKVDRRISKPVPVDIRYNGTLPENFMADKEGRILDYENVTVTGPQTVIDKIAMARIDVDLEGRVESLSQQYQYTLCDAEGNPVDSEAVVTDVEGVNLTLKIVRVKEVELTVSVLYGGGATVETAKVTVEPGVILVSGSDALLEDLTQLELGTVNLQEMPESEVLIFPIKLPEGITNETGVTEAKVHVEFPGLGLKELTVKNIQAVNVPEGLQVQMITQQLELVLRGPENLISSITEENVTVKVDFSQEQAGTASVKAQITVNVDGVGAVGVYNVTATLKTK